MMVLEGFRSKGAGRDLVERFKEWCKSNKAERIKVLASSKNKRGADFYRKCGFKDYNIVMEMVL